MKRISCLADLRAYGFETLTGEACGVGLRILCDVNESGRQLFAKAFGLPPDLKLEQPWNSRVNGRPSVGAVMLGREDYFTIGVFALLGAGCRTVYRFVPSRTVFESYQRLVAALREQRMLLPPDDAAAAPVLHNAWTEAVKKLSDDALSVTHLGSIFSPDMLMGIEEGDAGYLDRYLELAKHDGWTFESWRMHGTAGDRNRHEMSGRVT